MDCLAPPYEMCVEAQYGLRNGESLPNRLRTYIYSTDADWSSLLIRWLWALENGKDTDAIKAEIKSTYRRNLLELLERGWRGFPILAFLEEYEKELEKACRDELQDHLARLPFRMMLVMLLLQLPAYLMVLIGPLIFQLMEGMIS